MVRPELLLLQEPGSYGSQRKDGQRALGEGQTVTCVRKQGWMLWHYLWYFLPSNAKGISLWRDIFILMSRKRKVKFWKHCTTGLFLSDPSSVYMKSKIGIEKLVTSWTGSQLRLEILPLRQEHSQCLLLQTLNITLTLQHWNLQKTNWMLVKNQDFYPFLKISLHGLWSAILGSGDVSDLGFLKVIQEIYPSFTVIFEHYPECWVSTNCCLQSKV